MAVLDGQVALVTGATRGIGKAIALALGGAGAKLVGTISDMPSGIGHGRPCTRK